MYRMLLPKQAKQKNYLTIVLLQLLEGLTAFRKWFRSKIILHKQFKLQNGTVNTKSGKMEKMQLLEVPFPVLSSGQVLVRNHYSLISAGTRRAKP